MGWNYLSTPKHKLCSQQVISSHTLEGMWLIEFSHKITIIIVKSEIWIIIYTLFMVRSWNSGVRCMPCYALVRKYKHSVWYCYELLDTGKKMICRSLSPRKPHALAWGRSSSHTKIFRVERARLKTGEKFLIPCKFCSYRFIRYSSTCYGKVRIFEILTFLLPRWWMPPGLLWFGHFIWIGTC